MELKNPLYKNIGIHVVSNIFTVDKGITKVLLIKRTNNPYKGYWALPGGAMYNNELVIDAAKRELKEKTGIKDIDLSMHKILDSDILKSLFPNEFTLPELHNVYTSILNVDIDRRNFRKKMINLNLISDTNKTVVYKGKKPAKLYRFNEIEKNKSIF